ncbi:PREDICTED: non-classical arabinogalactan protein 30-like [Brassica oleracea var. oleracea]|uniref:Uncharacterized protein n=1 Tax=Brassica oleracea var. oleracea TaxID=109376 RepID=A0A0D3BTQ7_BRAOL|nr:PREDICTED: non-classical arabinogalactan protein 30-like [Brassica oleracea var. oleracea]
MVATVLLTLIALCYFISSVFSTTAQPPMKLITPLPTLPPAKAPIKIPTLPPAKAPTKVPTLPPAIAPIKPPVLPPVSPPKFNRTLVAVRGVVFCKAYKYAGVNILKGAKPVKGTNVDVHIDIMSPANVHIRHVRLINVSDNGNGST